MYSITGVRQSTNLIEDAGVAELADAQASGACGSNIVWVQVPSPASFFIFSAGEFIYIFEISKIFIFFIFLLTFI